jgi:hypothetical protein
MCTMCAITASPRREGETGQQRGKEKKIEGVRHVGRLPEVRIALAILV